jgi:hypothetical protein
MRRTAAGVGLGVVFLLVGCNLTNWGVFQNRNNGVGPPPPEPTAEQLVAYLNENSKLLQSLRVDELGVRVQTGAVMAINLRGRMVCQQPRNFHLSASLLGKDEVELGSNQDEFWYWIAKDEAKAQIHCSYQDLEAGRVRQMPFPFQPQWLLEALGMSTYGPPGKYKLEVFPEQLRLVERTHSPQGTELRKVIVFNRRPVMRPKSGAVWAPQVTDYILQDAAGKDICTAHITECQVGPKVGSNGALFPREIALNWPANKLHLTLRLDGAAANVNFQPGFPAFVRRPMHGLPSIDLATGRMDAQPGSLQRAGATFVGPR